MRLKHEVVGTEFPMSFYLIVFPNSVFWVNGFPYQVLIYLHPHFNFNKSF